MDPATPVGDLRVGQQQIVEIARALSIDARILIMDEPTSALAAREVEILFGIIDDLTSRGVSLVYISHHLEETLRVTDHAVVLRDGTMTARGDRADIDLAWIVRHMVGENFDLGSPPEGHQFGEPVLRDRRISRCWTGEPRASRRDRLSLSVRAGEIVCVYGLMGAGRTELLEAVAGRARTSPEAGSSSRARRSASTRSRDADRPAASAWCPRTVSGTGWCRPCPSARTSPWPASVKFLSRGCSPASKEKTARLRSLIQRRDGEDPGTRRAPSARSPAAISRRS